MGLVKINQDGSVQSWIETEQFKYVCDVMNRLYTEGQINPDILLGDWGGDDYTWTLAFDCHEEYLLPSLQRNVPEADVDVIQLNEDKGDFITFFSWNCKAVPITSPNPEAGIQFMQWLYANKENHDLLLYGIEGVTYESDNPRQWTPFRDAADAVLYEFGDWMTAYGPYRRFSTDIPLDIAEFSVRDRLQDVPAPTLSPYIGFQFDASTIAEVMTNIQAEYKRALDPIVYGVLSYDEGFENALSIMKTAGLDTYVEEYAKQFAAYLESI
jgi:putative aldouronate transport system substrate-binding protein